MKVKRNVVEDNYKSEINGSLLLTRRPSYA